MKYEVVKFNILSMSYYYYNSFKTYTEACEAVKQYERQYGKGFEIRRKEA